MFPFSFTSFSGSKSIFVEAWNPSPNFVDNVDNVITKDPTTFFSPAKNGQAPRGPTILAKDGQTLIFVNHSTSSGLVVVVENGPTLFMGNLASFIDSANHGRYNPNVISSDNVVETFDFQSNSTPFVPPCKKQKNEGKNNLKIL
jgi:hypothetical protein